MALGTLKHRNVAQVNGMLKWLVRFVAVLAFVIGKRSQINRMSEWSGLHILFGCCSRIEDHRVADVAVVGNDFAAVADVFAIVTTKAAGEIKVADVVWVSLPVGLHLRKKVSLKDPLKFGNRVLDRALLLRVQVLVVRSIKLTQTFINRG